MSKQSIEITGIKKSKLSSIKQEKTEGNLDQDQNIKIGDVEGSEIGPVEQKSKHGLPEHIEKRLLFLEQELLNVKDLPSDIRKDALRAVNNAVEESKKKTPALSSISNFIKQAASILSSVLSNSAPIIRTLKEIIEILK